jgi:hypothetical protein
LLKAALSHGGFGAKSGLNWLSHDLWEKMVGLVTQNAIGITLGSPVREYLEQLLGAVVSEATAEGSDAPSTLPTGVAEFAEAVHEAARAWRNENPTGSSDDEDEDNTATDNESSSDGDGGGDDGGGAFGDARNVVASSTEADSVLTSAPDVGADEMTIPECSELVRPATQLTQAYNSLPEVDGSGLFPAIALINHACEANVSIEYAAGSASASVVATRRILKGEEVCHSYVSTETLPSRRDRAWALQQYGFRCACALCEAATEESSSEEEGANTAGREDAENDIGTDEQRSYGEQSYWVSRYEIEASAAAQQEARGRRKRPRGAAVAEDWTDEWLLSFAELRDVLHRALAWSSGRKARVLEPPRHHARHARPWARVQILDTDPLWNDNNHAMPPPTGSGPERRAQVLDIGCGTSRLLADLREDGHEGALVGIDIAGLELAAGPPRHCRPWALVRCLEIDAQRKNPQEALRTPAPPPWPRLVDLSGACRRRRVGLAGRPASS